MKIDREQDIMVGDIISSRAFGRERERVYQNQSLQLKRFLVFHTRDEITGDTRVLLVKARKLEYDSWDNDYVLGKKVLRFHLGGLFDDSVDLNDIVIIPRSENARHLEHLAKL